MNNKKRKTNLSIAYDDACRQYAQAFAEKHEMYYDDECWIAGDFGTILNLGDYFFNFQEIKYDVDNDIDKDEIFKYYDYSLRAHTLGFEKIMNYENWCKGCPRISEETFAEAEKLHADIEKSKKLLNQLIEDKNNRK